jgi:Tfp pilus assembly protein FimT
MIMYKKERGITLVSLLVAIALFLILSVMAWEYVHDFLVSQKTNQILGDIKTVEASLRNNLQLRKGSCPRSVATDANALICAKKVAYGITLWDLQNAIGDTDPSNPITVKGESDDVLRIYVDLLGIYTPDKGYTVDEINDAVTRLDLSDTVIYFELNKSTGEVTLGND